MNGFYEDLGLIFVKAILPEELIVYHQKLNSRGNTV